MPIVPVAVLVKVVVSVLLALPPGAPAAVLATALPDTVIPVSAAEVRPPADDRVPADVLLAHLPSAHGVPKYHPGRFGSPVVTTVRLVPLRNAWATGAARWTAIRRHAFATDPGNVRAAGTDRCDLALGRITVKWRWSLGVTAAERRALRADLSTCASTLIAPPVVVARPIATTPRAD